MSTFNGHLEEIPEICVDNFVSKNPSSLFFLSHCHTDHTEGLNRAFFERLKSHGNYIYCSHLSKLILENMHRDAEIEKLGVIKSLDTNSPKVMSLSLTVTCIPSGHCPGSLMFLFEKNDKTVLYTGDFRFNEQDLPKLKVLHNLGGQVPRKLDKIYLDTTFLSKSFAWLPSREESMKEVHRLTQKWLEKDERNFVSLECSANYGSEYLFIELSKRLKEKIHVKDFVYDNYARIVDIFPYITSDSSVRVHACRRKRGMQGWHCPKVDEEFVLVIVPSVFYWKDKDVSVISEKNDKRRNVWNVCYSTHSSYQELVAFIKYFKCREIFPCVDNAGVKEELKILLDEGKEEEGECFPRDFAFFEKRPKKMRLDEWESE